MKIIPLTLLQQVHTAQMADAAGSDKIEIVVAVIAVLFVGLIGYLISVDRRLKKLEK